MKAIGTDSTWARQTLLAVLLGGAGGQLLPSCNDRTPEPRTCYPEGQDWEVDEFGYAAGWCLWPVEDFQWGADGSPPPALPDAPPGVQLFPQVHCFDLEDSQACDACPVEETDALLRADFEERCGYEATYFKRGCYELSEGEGARRCCYKAMVGPACSSMD